MVTDSTTLFAGQATAAALQGAMESALAAGRIVDFCVAEDKLEDAILDEALQGMLVGDFATSSARFEAVRELNERLLSVLDGLAADTYAGDEESAEAIATARQRGTALLPRWTGFRDHALGMALRLAGRYAEAIDKFQSAADTWQAGNGDPEMIATARALATMCKGLEEMRRANFQPAAAAFMAAQSQFEEVATGRLAPPGDDSNSAAQAAQVDAMSCDMLYRMMASRASLFTGNFDAAVSHAEESTAAAQRIIDQRPSDAPAWAVAGATGDVHICEGWREMALGERHRRDSQWAEAIAAYRRAQRHFEQAAAGYLLTRLPQAEAVQEQMLNQAASLDMQIRQTEDQRDAEQKLLAQIASLEEAVEKRDADVGKIIDGLRNQGIFVSNVNEARAQVDVNVQLVQQVENHVHDQLGELRRAVVADDSLDEATKAKMVAGVDEALAGDQHGPGFRQRAGGVVEKLGEMAKAAGIVAGPVPVMIGTLVSLVGRWAKGD